MTSGGSPELRLTVRVTPRGGRDAIEGVRDGALLVRVAAPPADGAANDSVLRLVAEACGVPRRAVRLVVGAAGRHKLIGVAGADREVLRRRWPDLGV